MTDTTDKLRGLFLAALMVFSVFAGTVALAGTSAAANQSASIVSAVEYEDDSGTNYIEVVLDEPTGGTAGVAIDSPGGVTVTGNSTSGNTITATLSGDVTPNQMLDISVYTAQGSGTLVDSADDVTTTASAINEAALPGEVETVYKGEPVAVVANGDDDSITITGPDATISTSTGTNSQVFVFDTGRSAVSAGDDFEVQFEGAGSTAGFNVTSLGLTASATNTAITNNQNVTVDVYTNAGGPATFDITDSNGNVETTVVRTLTGGQEETFSLPEVPVGNYTVNVTDNQTSAKASTGVIQVSSGGDRAVLLGGSGVFSENVGDVMSIPLEFQGGATVGTVVIGSESTNYLLRAHVEDSDGDGEATLLFNTYTAGTQNANNDVVWAAGDDTVTDRLENDGAGYFNPANAHTDVLDTGNYDVNSTAGAYTGANSYQTSSQDVGTLDIRDRSTTDVTVYKAPSGATPDSWTAADVWSAKGDTITQSNRIADGDLAIYQVEASGIEGVLHDANKENATKAFIAEVNGGAQTSALDFYSTEVNPGPNEQAHTIPITEANTIVVSDPANNTYFVASWTDLLMTSPGNNEIRHAAYDANFSIKHASPLATDSNNTRKARYHVEEPSASIQTRDGIVQVRAQAGETISGSTNLAAGTQISVRIQSDSDTSPFVKQPSATVEEGGSWSTTADFSQESVGTNFTVRLTSPSSISGTSEDGQIVSNLDTTDTPTATPEPTGPTETATDTPTDPPMTPTETPGSGPGFGVIVALIALIGAALLAVRRNA